MYNWLFLVLLVCPVRIANYYSELTSGFNKSVPVPIIFDWLFKSVVKVGMLDGGTGFKAY